MSLPLGSGIDLFNDRAVSIHPAITVSAFATAS